ncbi:hypothetical protein ACLQ28_14790 [Micromonospora sp. DT201]
MSRTVIDGWHIRALKGGAKPVRARSTAAARLEQHVITDAGGIPSPRR